MQIGSTEIEFSIESPDTENKKIMNSSLNNRDY